MVFTERNEDPTNSWHKWLSGTMILTLLFCAIFSKIVDWMGFSRPSIERCDLRFRRLDQVRVRIFRCFQRGLRWEHLWSITCTLPTQRHQQVFTRQGGRSRCVWRFDTLFGSSWLHMIEEIHPPQNQNLPVWKRPTYNVFKRWCQKA